MVHINKSFCAAALLSSHFSYVAAEKFWLDSKCAIGDFEDAISEAIWVAERTYQAIVLRDTVTLDANSFKWFFGISPTPEDATTEYPYSEENSALIGDTFARIGALTQTEDRLSARLRIYCDNDARYLPVDSDGDSIPDPFLPVPDPSDNDAITARNERIRKTRFWDKDNDSVTTGNALYCRSTPAYAYGMTKIHETTARIATWFASAQDSDRFTITFCDTMLNNNNKGAGNAGKFWSLRALAERKLENLSGLYGLSPNAAKTVIHELVHVPFLSSQTVTIDGSSSGFEAGTDKHNGVADNGYYRGSKDIKPDFLSNSLTFKNLLMNPDSYAYVASILRLRDKQWEAYVSDAATNAIQFRKNLNLELRGDWPEATALAKRVLRFMRKVY